MLLLFYFLYTYIRNAWQLTCVHLYRFWERPRSPLTARYFRGCPRRAWRFVRPHRVGVGRLSQSLWLPTWLRFPRGWFAWACLRERSGRRLLLVWIWFSFRPNPSFSITSGKQPGIVFFSNCCFYKPLIINACVFLASFVVPRNIMFFLTFLLFFVTHCAHVF